MGRWYDGHVGELILATVFVLSLTGFTLVYLIKGDESQLLGGVSLAALSSLATYMQKRTVTENAETPRKPL